MVTILANVGVIAGIAFLAFELRQNTLVARSEASQTIQAHIVSILGMTTDPSLADVVGRGSTDPSSLTQQEWVQFQSFWTLTFASYENMYFQVIEGAYDAQRADGWWQMMRNHLENSGVRDHWESRQFLFAPEFRNFVDSEVMSRERPSEEFLALPPDR